MPHLLEAMAHRIAALLLLTVALLVVAVGWSAIHLADTDASDDGVANPWNASTLTVAVDAPPHDPRNYTRFVANTTAYWEQHDASYGDYQVNYAVSPDAANPDIIARFRSDVACNGTGAGCSFTLHGTGTAQEPEFVRVTTRYTADWTRRILRHEFGHLLGIDHGESPMPIMGEDLEHAMPRSLPWGRDRVTVYANLTAPRSRLHVEDPTSRVERLRRIDPRERRVYRDELRDSLEALGRVTETRFVVVDDRSRADVVVGLRFGFVGTSDGDAVPLEPGGDGWSLASRGRTDRFLNETGAKRVSTYHVEVGVRAPPEAFAWHVGHWLSRAIDGERVDRPAALAPDVDPSTRRAWPDGSHGT